jgi:hypothetical protein
VKCWRGSEEENRQVRKQQLGGTQYRGEWGYVKRKIFWGKVKLILFFSKNKFKVCFIKK